MGIIHGRGGVVYMGGSSAGAVAVNVAKLDSWSLDVDYDVDQFVGLGSTWAEAVRGANRWSGSLTGAFNTADKLLWLASLSNTSVPMYIYPDGNEFESTNNQLMYYYGTCFLKIGVAGGAGHATVRASIVGDDDLFIGSA